MDKIINGKEIKERLSVSLQDEINNIKEKLKLVVIQIGDYPASNVYISNKEKLCISMNIDFELLKYETVTEEELINKIMELNNNSRVTGILLQLPIPSNLNINKDKVIEVIDPKKDVDGLTTTNVGLLFNKKDAIIPCTAYGVMELLKAYNIELEGKSVVIVGRSNLVGLPLIALLLNENATVTICHSKTKNLELKTKEADILIVAVGQKHLIKKDMIKENAILIDVGINREDKLYGDVDFDDCYDKCLLITPVPGGVGPMTTIMLINNIIKCYKLQNKKI